MGYTPGIYHQDESIAAVLHDVARAHRIMLELTGPDERIDAVIARLRERIEIVEVV